VLLGVTVASSGLSLCVLIHARKVRSNSPKNGCLAQGGDSLVGRRGTVVSLFGFSVPFWLAVHAHPALCRALALATGECIRPVVMVSL